MAAQPKRGAGRWLGRGAGEGDTRMLDVKLGLEWEQRQEAGALLGVTFQSLEE